MAFETCVEEKYKQGRFATAEEIMSVFPTVDFRKNNNKFGGLPIISNGNTGFVENLDNSCIVFGSSGSKKTRDVVIPTIVSEACAGTSMFINDNKGEIYRIIGPRLEQLGYRIVFLDFENPQNGDCYNPFKIPATLYKMGCVDSATDMLKHFSETLFEKYRDDSDPMWHQTSASYCTALAEILCKYFEIEDVTIDNIYNLHLQGEERVISESHVFGPPVPTYFKAFFSDKKVENAYKLIYPTLCAPNETKSSIHCVFTSCLSSLVLNSAIKDMMSRSSFDVIDIVKEPTAVFIFTRETRSVYSPLITACIDQFYDVLLEYADSHGGCLERRVKFIIDEFANLTKINKFETKISASRSRNILWMLVCQSLEQISLVYGNDVASIILGNSNDIVYLHSPDLNLINKISAMCGERVDEYTGQKEPLCPMELLRHFDKQSGEALFLIERLHPFITHLPDISKYYGVKPVDELNIRKRSNVYRQPIDFQKFVDEGSSKTRKQRRS